MSSRDNNRDLSITAFSVILIFIGGAVLADTKNLPYWWTMLFIGIGNVLLGIGIYLGYRPIKKLSDKQRSLEEFFGIKPKEFVDSLNAVNFDKSKNSEKTSLRDKISFGANIATIVVVVLTLVTLFILIQTTTDNKVVIDELKNQLDESKKNVDLLTTMITNSYVDYKPNLILQIHPINESYFGGNNPHQFLVDVSNYGQKWSLVNMTWEFGIEGGCFHGQPIDSLHMISNTNQVVVKKGDSDLVEPDVPDSFENIKNLTSFSVKLGVLEYPYDQNLGKIQQYMKYNWAFFTFDYDDTYKMWIPHPWGDHSTPCEIPTLPNSRLVLNTSDTSMQSYDVSR